MLDCKIKKSEDCVLIEVGNWLHTSELEIRKINGKVSTSCITKVKDIHIHSRHYSDCLLRKDDIILISEAASDIAGMLSFPLEDEKKYYYVPISQVLGFFRKETLSLANLELLYDKILIEKINTGIYNGIAIPNSHEMIGRVIKIGTHKFTKEWESIPLEVQIGDIVVLKDNVSTPVRFENKEYYIAEEKNVVGIFKREQALNTEDIKFINKYILMKSYYPKKVLNSTVLETPNINYEDLDYSDVYNRNLFQIKYLDKENENLKQEDVVLVSRDYTNYVYLNQEKYFLLDGERWVAARIKE